jgi:hypothetical protein
MPILDRVINFLVVKFFLPKSQSTVPDSDEAVPLDVDPALPNCRVEITQLEKVVFWLEFGLL